MGLKTDYEPGLATEKHAQAMTERGALSQRYEKASRALAAAGAGGMAGRQPTESF